MKKRVWSLLLEGALYLFCALLILKCFPLFIHDIGSDDHLFWYLLPYYLETVLFIYLLFVVHYWLHPASQKGKRLTLTVNGIILTVLSFAVILVDVIHLSTGDYSSIIMGHPTLGYPMDNLILAFLLLIIGFVMYLKGTRFVSASEHLFTPRLKSTVVKVIAAFFYGLLVLCSLWYLGDFLLSFIAFDTSLEHLFGFICLLLMMISPTVLLAIKEFYLDELSDEEKQRKMRFRLAIIFTSIAVFLIVYLTVALSLDSDLILLGTPAYFPLDLMASVNLGPISLILINLLPPIFMFKK